MPGNTIYYWLKFMVSHTIPAGGNIKLTLSSSTFPASICFIKSFMTDNGSLSATCGTLSSTELEVLNFGEIPKGTTVILQQPILIGSIDVALTVDTTYGAFQIDTGTLKIIDIDATCVYFPSMSLSPSGTRTMNVEETFSLVLRPTVSLTPGSKIYVSFPDSFGIYTSSCVQTANTGSGATAINCVLDGSVMVLTTNTDIISTSGDSTFAFTIKNPRISSNNDDISQICVRSVPIGSADPANVRCFTYTVETLAIGAETILTADSTKNDIYVPFRLTFQSPLATENPDTFVRIRFNTASNGFPLDLGVTGFPDCEFTGVSDMAFCEVVPPTSIPPYVEIWFKSLGAFTSDSSSVKFLIKSAKNPGIFDYRIHIGYFENRIYKDIARNLVRTFTTVVSTTPWTSTSISARSSLVINEESSIAFSVWSPVAVSGIWKVYFQFPISWDISEVTSISLYSISAGTSSANPVEIFNSDYSKIIIATISTGAMSSTDVTTVTISGLINPLISSYNSPTTVTVGLIDASGVMQAYSDTSNNLEISTVASLDDAELTIDPADKSHPSALYTFKFTSKNGIPNQGKVEIVFPGIISGISSAIIGHNIQAQTSNHMVGNTVTISGFSEIEKGEAVEIYFEKIPTPNVASMSGFTITTKDSSNNNYDSTSLTSSLDTSFTSGSIIIKHLNFEPSNIHAKSTEFLISFWSDLNIPIGSVIEIFMP